MKNLFIVLFIFAMNVVSAQNSDTAETSKITVKSFKIHCESAKELKTIDWNDIHDIIQQNDPEDVVALEFGVHHKVQTQTKVKGTFNFKLKGKTKDVEKIIIRAKKGVNALKKMSTKN
jgi:kynurenine formamidase